jgi:predicted transposase/invertase (TIGR01784 family)
MIELTKVPEESDGKAVWDWMKFLGGKRKEDFEMLAEKNSEVRGAVNTLYRLSEDPEVRARIEYREKARRDHAALLHAAVEEGEARGEARSRAEIARNMKNLGLPPEMIEKATGLGPEAVKQL